MSSIYLAACNGIDVPVHFQSMDTNMIDDAAADKRGIARLAALLGSHTPGDGSFELCVPGVHAFRMSRPSAELIRALQQPALCIIAQGSKTVMLGDETYDYGPTRMLVFSVDLPVAAQVTQASPSRPYLSLRLDISPQRISELVLKVYPGGVPQSIHSRAIYLATASEPIVGASARLLELMSHPDEAALLAPLVVDEILIRLLRSSVGGRLAQLGNTESHVHRISRAVSWVKLNFAQPIRTEDLADLVHMSTSSLHQHFKAVTSMSPLQYQKVLRLQEARRLMLTGGIEGSLASRQVGYLSPSQFSREYARFFGSAPSKDISRLRNGGPADAPVTLA